jgi:hypothetical protein
MCVSERSIFGEENCPATGNVKSVATSHRSDHATRADRRVAEGVMWIPSKPSIGTHLQSHGQDFTFDEPVSKFCSDLGLGFARLTSPCGRLDRVNNFSSEESHRFVLATIEGQTQVRQFCREVDASGEAVVAADFATSTQVVRELIGRLEPGTLFELKAEPWQLAIEQVLTFDVIRDEQPGLRSHKQSR